MLTGTDTFSTDHTALKSRWGDIKSWCGGHIPLRLLYNLLSVGPPTLVIELNLLIAAKTPAPFASNLHHQVAPSFDCTGNWFSSSEELGFILNLNCRLTGANFWYLTYQGRQLNSAGLLVLCLVVIHSDWESLKLHVTQWSVRSINLAQSIKKLCANLAQRKSPSYNEAEVNGGEQSSRKKLVTTFDC